MCSIYGHQNNIEKMGLSGILSINNTVTIGTMLSITGGNKGSVLKDITCKQTLKILKLVFEQTRNAMYKIYHEKIRWPHILVTVYYRLMFLPVCWSSLQPVREPVLWRHVLTSYYKRCTERPNTRLRDPVPTTLALQSHQSSLRFIYIRAKEKATSPQMGS